MSGGSIRAASGELTFMVAAADAALAKCRSVLDVMGRVFVVGCEPGRGSAMKMINQVLAGVHIAVEAEAIALAAKESLNTRQVFDIITTAAGNSFCFENRVPHMLDDDPTPHSALDIWPKDLGIVIDEAKRLGLPCPLATTALQQFLAAKGLGLGSKDDSFVVKVYETLGGVTVACPRTSSTTAPRVEASSLPKVGFIGLGAMGRGMACTLAKKGVSVQVFDVRPEACDDVVKLGGTRSSTPRACAEGVDVLVVAVVNSQQVSSVLFDCPDAALGGGFRGVCVVCATVSPAFPPEAAKKAAEFGVTYVDAPMSGGSIRAAKGELTFMIAAEDTAVAKCRGVLEAMGKVFVVGCEAGRGSAMKMINQVLAGVHIAVAAEAMALAAKECLNTRQVYDIITACAGNSFMFENRVPHMLDDDPTPHSALDIWLKDLGIVTDEAKRVCLPCPLASCALQQFLAGKALGHGSNDDSFVVKVYEKFGSPPVACKANTAKQGYV
jgi:3-hydroxyisobutyrate dehydrogenase-like beta-hydroxyacid dehydrogenase